MALQALRACLCSRLTNYVDRNVMVSPRVRKRGTDTLQWSCPEREFVYEHVRVGPPAGYQEKDVLMRVSR